MTGHLRHSCTPCTILTTCFEAETPSQMIVPGLSALKATPSGTTTRFMIASNGTRAAVPCSRPLLGSTIARIAAIAVLTFVVIGWNTVPFRRAECMHSTGATFAAGTLTSANGDGFAGNTCRVIIESCWLKTLAAMEFVDLTLVFLG